MADDEGAQEPRPRELEDRTALITGGSSGIGKATATTLAEAGARVMIGYRSRKQEAEALAKELGSERAAAQQLDVARVESVRAAVQACATHFSGPDILVNTATYANPKAWKAPLAELSLPDWQRTLDVDLTGTFLCAQQAAEQLSATGKGAIVNFSSSAAVEGDPDTLLYNAAKMGVIGLTRSLARSMAPAVRVNAIAPGSIRTGWVDSWGLSEEEVAELAKEVPLKRIGTPEEVARAVLYLVSDRSKHVTGQTLFVDGGMHD